jgi:hypothetical protein
MSVTTLSCRCGKVQLAVSQAPIIVSECHCNSCREAARRMAQLPGAPAVAGTDGGTHFVLYRKDRVSISSGFELLRNFRLGPERQTRRVIASCCNTPVLLEFKGGHWASLYGNLWHGQNLPAPHLRTMTGDSPVVLDDSVTAGRWATAKFYGRLLSAWAGMGFRAPALALDTPEIKLEG